MTKIGFIEARDHVVRDAAEFFALTKLATGRYVSQDGLAWDVSDVGPGDWIQGGKYVTVIPDAHTDVTAFHPSMTHTAMIERANSKAADIFVPQGVELTLDRAAVTSKRIYGGGVIKLAADSPYAIRLDGICPMVEGMTFNSTSGKTGRCSEIKIGDGCIGPTITGCYFVSRASVYSAIVASDDPETPAGSVSDYPYSNKVSQLSIIGSNRFEGNYARYILLACVDGYNISGNFFKGGRFDSIRLRESIGNGIISSNTFDTVGDQSWPDAQTRDCIDTAFGGGRLTISNNIMIRPAFCGIDIKGVGTAEGSQTSSDIIITGNRIYGARMEGITIAESLSSGKGVSRFVITGNSIISCNMNNTSGSGSDGVAGVAVGQFAAYANISDNIIVGNYGRGLYVRDFDGGGSPKAVLVKGNILVNNKDCGAQLQNVEGLSVVDNWSGVESENVYSHDFPGNPSQLAGFRFIYSNAAARGTVIFKDNHSIGNTSIPVSISPSGSMVDIFHTYGPNRFAGADADFASSNRSRWAQQPKRTLWGSTTNPPTASEGTFNTGDRVFEVSPANGGYIGSVKAADGNWYKFGQVEVGIKSGTTANRPSGVHRGFDYFDTSLSKPIWWDGTQWKDATGTIV